MNLLQRSMFNRYFWFAKYADYCNRDRLWWWLLVPMTVFYTLGRLPADGWSVLGTFLLIGCLTFIRWMAKEHPHSMGSITNWWFYSTYMEGYFWGVWVGFGLELVAFAIGTIHIGDVIVASGQPVVALQTLFTSFAVTIHTYLLADIFAPPRPRKKVRVSIKLPVRQALPEAA